MQKLKIDINCDMGESADFDHDKALMKHITSVNIACGYHAGNEYIMERTVEEALNNNLLIGAHPGFSDKEHFGRNEIELSPREIKILILDQLELINEIVIRKGGSLNHVKPHGALYNMSTKRMDYAIAIAEAVYDFDHQLILFGLSESVSILEAERVGLNCFSEVFSDRAYLSDGKLAPRSIKGAVFTDIGTVLKQAECLMSGKKIKTIDGKFIKLKADTICIHSDTTNALNFAEAIFSIASAAI